MLYLNLNLELPAWKQYQRLVDGLWTFPLFLN